MFNNIFFIKENYIWLKPGLTITIGRKGIYKYI